MKRGTKREQSLKKKDAGLKEELIIVAEELAHIGGWEFDALTQEGIWTDELARIHDLEPGHETNVEFGLSFYTPESRLIMEKAVEEAVKLGRPYDLELEIVSAKGVKKSVRTIGKPVLKDGKIVKVRGFLQDITSYKKVETALNESRDKLERISYTIPGMLYDYELYPNGKSGFVYVSPQCRYVLGVEPDALLSDSNIFFNMIHEEDKTKLLAEEESATRARRDFRTEVRIITPDGKLKWIYINSRGNPAHEGEPVVWSGLMIDITERKEMEDMLRIAKSKAEENEQIKSILLERMNEAQETARIGSWEMDLKTNSIWWSDELYRILELDPNEITLDKETISRYIHPDDTGPFLQEIGRVIHTGGHFNFIVRVISSGGALRYCNAKGRIEYAGTSGQEVTRFFGTFMDITDIKRMEEDREKLLIKLAQSQKLESVGRLAGGIAHDFNNMLAAIIGRAELALSSMDDSSPVYADIFEIRKAAQHSADLTRRLLAFSRRQLTSRIVLDLNEAIFGMLRMMRYVAGDNIEITWLPAGDACTVKIDPVQIDQILGDLILNARDAINGAGNVTIAVKKTEFDKAYCDSRPGVMPGRFVMLSVSDSGAGMDKDVLEHIFEPFFTTKDIKSAGMGLSGIYGIVKQNGGFIDVESKPGKGTTFNIYLPRA